VTDTPEVERPVVEPVAEPVVEAVAAADPAADAVAQAAPADDAEPAAEDTEPETSILPAGPLSRRSFVVKSLAVVGGVSAALVAIPVIGFAAAPGWRSSIPVRFLSTSVAPTLRSDTWTSVGMLTDFTVGVPQYIKVERHVVDGWVEENAPIGVHVVRQSDTEAVVFDPHCTHLGCPLAWSEGAGSFVCPCHGGSFGSDGNVKSGPPPRSMVRYETKVVNGELFIGALPAGA
jgi:menaquinol-cytochrome c reductase iron-sulfur subunit